VICGWRRWTRDTASYSSISANNVPSREEQMAVEIFPDDDPHAFPSTKLIAWCCSCWNFCICTVLEWCLEFVHASKDFRWRCMFPQDNIAHTTSLGGSFLCFGLVSTRPLYPRYRSPSLLLVPKHHDISITFTSAPTRTRPAPSSRASLASSYSYP